MLDGFITFQFYCNLIVYCYFPENNQKMLIDIDSKGKDEILQHVIKVLGKPS